MVDTAVSTITAKERYLNVLRDQRLAAFIRGDIEVAQRRDLFIQAVEDDLAFEETHE